MKGRLRNQAASCGMVLLGNFLLALTVKLFILPVDMVTGGVTGIALAIHHGFGVSVSLVVFLLNGVLMLLGWRVLGTAFAVSALLSTFWYPIALGICEWIFKDWVITKDIFLCTLFAGVGFGVSLGIVIRTGASTAGMDIPPLILNKAFHIPVSFSLYVFDFLILMSQLTVHPVEKVLYGVVLILIETQVLDKVLLLGTVKMEIKIISRSSKEIQAAILNTLDRGITLLHGEGGYLHEEIQMILCVVSNREVAKVEKLAHQIDSECFLVVSRATEVRGHGFSLKKKYLGRTCG